MNFYALDTVRNISLPHLWDSLALQETESTRGNKPLKQKWLLKILHN